MKKSIIIWLVMSIIVMFVFPWLAVNFINGDAGMAACFILFYGIDPIYSLIIGRSAGKDIKHLWSLPVISAVLFLSGAWIFFDMGEIAFIMYSFIYLILGIVAMLVSMLINKKIQQKQAIIS